MTDQLSTIQRAAANAYACGDHAYIETAEQAETVGDTLFLFIMRELSDACGDRDEALRMLDVAKRDIDEVIAALEALPEPTEIKE